jgi:cation:H+ antiporter
MLGSNIFNLLILALLALLMPKRFQSASMQSSHTSSMIYGVALLALFSVSFMLSQAHAFRLPLLNCGPVTLLLPLAYAAFLVLEHRRQPADQEKEESLPEESRLTQMPATRFYSTLLGLCALIILGGIALSLLGSRMALPPEEGGFGLEASFIGTLFLAVSTSLPELVISFSALRLGLLDMAVGNVLGSNMFNLLIIFAADVTMRKGNLLAEASSKNWTSVLLIFLLSALATGLLRLHTSRKSLLFAVIMILAYILSLSALT